jgi:hypothetical protein
MVVFKIKKLQEEVYRLLSQYPPYRDNDIKLISHIWMEQLGGKENMSNISLLDFCKNWVGNPNISNPDSITRARRLVQAEHKDLRGEVYSHRTVQSENVRTLINS